MPDQKHNIQTINDIFDVVTKENLPRFLADFNELVTSFVFLKEQATKNGLPVESVKPHKTFWTDDNKREINITFEPKK
jgi:hypothetical protein